MMISSSSGHSYSFAGDSITWKSPLGRELALPFAPRLALRRSSWTGALTIKGREGTIPLSHLSSSEQASLLAEFFRRWRAADPEAAKKSAFDYIDGQRQFLPVAFVVSVAFCLPLAVALLNDSREQSYCTRVLQAESAVGTMDVTKFRKKRKGHYILQLRFVTPTGTEILGQDQLILGKEGLDEEIERRIPKTVPVVYAPKEPRCWSLTPNLEGTEVNWAKRRYFAAFTALFGAFFLMLSLLGAVWSALNYFRQRPHREAIAKQFSL